MLPCREIAEQCAAKGKVESALQSREIVRRSLRLPQRGQRGSGSADGVLELAAARDRSGAHCEKPETLAALPPPLGNDPPGEDQAEHPGEIDEHEHR